MSGDGCIVAWNEEAETLLGHSPEEVVGRYCYEVLRTVFPDGQPLCTAGCPAGVGLGCGIPFAARTCLYPHKNGQWMRVALSSMAVPEAMDDGETAAIIFVRPSQELPEPTGDTDVLRILTMGRFGLVVGDHPIATDKWDRKQALTLLKRLITANGRAVHRDVLIECLWPTVSPRQGLDRLKTTVYSLRKQLRKAGVTGEVIGSAEFAYFVHREKVWVDSEVFCDLVKQGEDLARLERADEATMSLQRAVDMYRGDYLEEDLYTDWCAEERERLREVWFQAMEQLAALYAIKGDAPRAVQICRQALASESCRESLHRALMLYLWYQGREDEAVSQYHACARILNDALGVEPAPQTQRMYYQILQPAEPALTTN
jgi:DNA-binding SARP family transcriptional activator